MVIKFEKSQLNSAQVIPVVVEASDIKVLPVLSIKEINAALAQIIVKEEK